MFDFILHAQTLTNTATCYFNFFRHKIDIRNDFYKFFLSLLSLVYSPDHTLFTALSATPLNPHFDWRFKNILLICAHAILPLYALYTTLHISC